MTRSEVLRVLERMLGLASSQLADPDASASPYFPPTDPVLAGNHVLGGFSPTCMEHQHVVRSGFDHCIGDEALAQAVRSELRQDAATSALALEISVEEGVVYLRGAVAGIEDVVAAEEVAGRISGVLEVVEELEIELG